MAAEDLAMIDNADLVLLGPAAIDRSRNLIVRHERRADPWGVFARCDESILATTTA
jgi:hypothetical protein